MAASVPKNYRERGLTLIEVLIALAIIGIALTAVIKATSQTIKSTSYLQDKTMAAWVAQEIIGEAKTGLIHVPNAPDHLLDKTKMLGRTWYWQASLEKTPNRHINKIVVNVYKNKNDEENPMMNLESYILHEE